MRIEDRCNIDPYDPGPLCMQSRGHAEPHDWERWCAGADERCSAARRLYSDVDLGLWSESRCVLVAGHPHTKHVGEVEW